MSLLALLATLSAAHARTYGRCELARELSEVHGLPPRDVATWVCIARHESDYNTSAVGHLAGASGDHGIFQISDRYWCSPPGRGTACGLDCALLEDDDLADDVACALRIHRDHERLDGDGFQAWTVYPRWCRGDVSGYVRGCDVREGPPATEAAPTGAPLSVRPFSETTSLEYRGNPWDHRVSTSAEIPTSTALPTFKSTSKSTTSHWRRKHKLKSTLPPVTKKPKKTPAPYNSLQLSPTNDGSTSEGRPGALGTGWQRRRPALRDLDPRSAWFSVHYDPRFLDETS